MGSKINPKNKIVFLIRHGIRADSSGLIPIFGINDTELTEKGKELSEISGKNICKKLKEFGYTKENTKIQIISSPFVRALQTSRHIKEGVKSEGYSINETVKIDCFLSDGARFNGEFPKNFLNIFHQNENFKKEFENDKFDFLNGVECLPGPGESFEEIRARMGKALELLKNVCSEEYNVYICSTSAWPILEYGIMLGYKEKRRWWNYDYYDSIYFSLDENKKPTFIGMSNMAEI